MALGMSWEQFWHGEPEIYKMFREAYAQKKRMENEKLWLQGLYNFVALQTALGNAFRGKGEEPKPYLQEPFPLTAEDKEAREEREQQKQYENGMAMMQQWVKDAKAAKEAEKTAQADSDSDSEVSAGGRN